VLELGCGSARVVSGLPAASDCMVISLDYLLYPLKKRVSWNLIISE